MGAQTALDIKAHHEGKLLVKWPVLSEGWKENAMKHE